MLSSSLFDATKQKEKREKDRRELKQTFEFGCVIRFVYVSRTRSFQSFNTEQPNSLYFIVARTMML